MSTKLDIKQWAIATLAVFVILTIFALIMNRVVVPTEATPQTPVESDATSRILVYLSRLVFAALFTYVYSKADGKVGLGHGLRYGVGIGLLFYIPWYLNGLAGVGFAFIGWTASAQTVFTLIGLVQTMVCGLIVAQLYKPGKPAAA